MLDNLGRYQSADNLPKWLKWAGHKKVLDPRRGPTQGQFVVNRSAKNFPGGPWDANKRSSWDKVSKILQMILDNSNPPASMDLGDQSLVKGKGGLKL